MSDLGDWYETQIEPLAGGLKSLFSVLVEGTKPEDVVGFGVISDPTDFTLTVAINTKQHMLKQMGLFAKYGYDPDEAALHCLWNPGEWGNFSMPEHDRDFPQAAQFATEAQRRSEAFEDPDLGVMMFWECIVRALAKLFKAGFFDTYENAIQVFNVVDIDFSDLPVERWMGGINTQAALDSYRDFLKLY